MCLITKAKMEGYVNEDWKFFPRFLYKSPVKTYENVIDCMLNQYDICIRVVGSGPVEVNIKPATLYYAYSATIYSHLRLRGGLLRLTQPAHVHVHRNTQSLYLILLTSSR